MPHCNVYHLIYRLSVDCQSGYSCRFTDIYCPDNCSITCGDDYGCYDTDIYVEDDLDPINIDCGGSSTSCSTLSINCDSGDLSSLIFNDIYSNWTCQTYGCCPIVEREEIICPANEHCIVCLYILALDISFYIFILSLKSYTVRLYIS